MSNKIVLEKGAGGMARFVRPYPFILAEGSEEMALAFAAQSTAQGWPVTFIEPEPVPSDSWDYPVLEFYKRPDGFISYRVIGGQILGVAPEDAMAGPEAEKTEAKPGAKTKA